MRKSAKNKAENLQRDLEFSKYQSCFYLNMPSVLSKGSGKDRKRLHSENQLIICSCCGEKDFKCIPVSGCLQILIQKFINPNYSSDINDYPTGKKVKEKLYVLFPGYK